MREQSYTMEPQTQPRVPEDPTTVRKTALAHIIDTVCLCQQRGGYTIDEAVRISTAINCFTPTAPSEDSAVAKADATTTVRTDETQTQQLQFQVNMLEKSQSQGKLSLREAWTVYNAIQIFSTPSNELPSE